jgi:type I restriction enzyme M protein
LPETARFDYLIDRPEAEDIGGAINAAMKAIADENEELGGALPRNYNSLEKPILRELLKILNRIPERILLRMRLGKFINIFYGILLRRRAQRRRVFYSHFTGKADCRCNRAELRANFRPGLWCWGNAGAECDSG